MTLRRDTEKARAWAHRRSPLKRSAFHVTARQKRRRWRQRQAVRPAPTPQQIRRRAYEAEHRAMRAVVLARDWWCRARVEGRCLGRSTEAHHVLSRGRGGPNAMWNYLGICNRCHGFVHTHPLEAEARGLLASVGACCELEARAA